MDILVCHMLTNADPENGDEMTTFLYTFRRPHVPATEAIVEKRHIVSDTALLVEPPVWFKQLGIGVSVRVHSDTPDDGLAFKWQNRWGMYVPMIPYNGGPLGYHKLILF